MATIRIHDDDADALCGMGLTQNQSRVELASKRNVRGDLPKVRNIMEGSYFSFSR